MNKFERVDRLNIIIDQAKFVRNILVDSPRYISEADFQTIERYIKELKEIVDGLK